MSPGSTGSTGAAPSTTGIAGTIPSQSGAARARRVTAARADLPAQEAAVAAVAVSSTTVRSDRSACSIPSWVVR